MRAFVGFLVAATLLGFFAACGAALRDRGAAQLWEENCMRCHNMFPVRSYTDPQWEVAVLHMRVRAHITVVEAEAITKFLKASNNTTQDPE